MKTQAFIDDLQRAGVVLTAQNNRLYIDAPTGIITTDIRDQLKAVKLEIIETLLRKKAPAKPKMKVYQISVRGKCITVLDPAGKTEREMRRSLLMRFGDNLDSMI